MWLSSSGGWRTYTLALGRCGVGKTRKTTCMEAMDVPTVGAVLQADSTEQRGKVEQQGVRLGRPGLQENPRGDSGVTVDAAQQVDAVVQCEECAKGRDPGP